MKKIILLVLSVLLVFSSMPVGAQGQSPEIIAVYDSAQSAVTVSGTFPNTRYSGVTITILPEGKNEGELSDTNLPADIRLTTTDGAGRFSTYILLNRDLPSGRYNCYANSGVNSAQSSFMHINPSEAANALVLVNACTSEGELHALLSDETTALLLGIAHGEFLENATGLVQLLFSWKGSGFASASEFYDAFTIAKACIKINSGTDIERVLMQNQGLLGISYENDFNSLNDTEKVKLKTLLKNTDYSRIVFSEGFYSNRFLALITSVDRWSVLKNIVLEDGEQFGMRTSAGSAYHGTADKDKVFSIMMKKGITGVSTIAEAVIIFNDAVAQANGTDTYQNNISSPPSKRSPQNTPSIEMPNELLNEETEVFTDIGNHWAREYIIKLHAEGVISGFSDNSFRPNGNITRAEFIKMMMRVMDIDESDTQAFEDVTKDDWFYGYVGGAFKAGIVKGEGMNFLPTELITREDAATMLYRYLSQQAGISKAAFNFGDNEKISDYAKEAVEALGAAGIVKGLGDGFHPKNPMTRAEAAVLFSNVADFV